MTENESAHNEVEKKAFWLNTSQMKLFESLKADKLVSSDIHTFVKSAFYEKVDNILSKQK